MKKLGFQFDGGSQPSRVIVADGANTSQYFILAGGVYVNEFTGWNSLEWDSGSAEFTLTMAGNGQQWVFHDHTAGALAGMLKRVADPAGRIVTCVYDLDNRLEKFEQVADGRSSGFYYAWTALGSVETVTLKLDDQPVRRGRFAYYSGSDSGGNLDDLRQAVIEQYDPGAEMWRIVSRKHYRYYRPGDTGGFVSGLKLVIGANACQMMLDAGLDPETATEAELASYADYYYEYDSEKRVTLLELKYDGGSAGGDGNVTEETRPVDATAANDRIITHAYDFRDRLESSTETDGTTTWITTITWDNLDRRTGATRYHNDVDNANRITKARAFYDALGRVFKQETDGIDPATGNVTGTLTGQNWYDLASNLIKQSQPGSTAFTKTHYDALNRQTASYLCCRPGTAGVPSGDDNNISADTVIEQTQTTYDSAGNVLQTIVRKRFDDATGTGALNGPNTQPKSRDTFTAFYPDAIGRVRVTAEYGTAGSAYQGRPSVAPARSDTILVTTNRYKDSGDANAVIDPMGIETRWENDKAGRRIKLIEGITAKVGQASSLPAAPCNLEGCPTLPRITEFVWHSSGQLGKLILVNADTGNQTTQWVFGTTLADSAIASNSLVRAKIFPESDDRPAPAADGPDGVYARLEYQYNRQGQQTQFKDADGTTHAYSYNKAGRMTEDRVTAIAAHLSTSVMRISYGYDNRGLAAKVTSHSAASGGSVVNEAAFEYDSFLQLAADKQSHSGAVTESTPKVTYTYETGGVKNTIRRIITTYPTSSRKLEQHHDANSIDDHLSRLSALKVFGAPTRLVEYHYMGAAWQARVVYPEPGVELTYKQLPGAPTGDAGDVYSGYDRFGRSIDMPWSNTAVPAVIERSQYGFDRDSRRTWQKRPQTSTQDLSYNYDALSQVTNAARGSLNLNQTAISGVPTFAEGWDYDPTGNWAELKQWGSTGQVSLDQDRVHDRGNRLTQIVGNAAPVLTDRAGRILQSAPDAAGNWSGKLGLTWDAWSRITAVANNGGPVADYQYDGLHRRITRNASGQPLIHTYYSDTWRPLEERRNAETTASAFYLWGARHRDDLARRDRAVGGTTLNETRYVLMDYFNPAAITDATGAVKERYAFSAFGVRSIMNPDWTARTTSESAFEFAFQGQFLDPESGLYNYGYRYYSPYLGRWTCKDPIGERGGNNLFSFASNNSTNFVDVLGLKKSTNCVPECEKALANAMNDPTIVALIETINYHASKGNKKCKVPTFNCECCPENEDKDKYNDRGGDFNPSTGTIRICCNTKGWSSGSVDNTVRHELTHAYDQCMGTDFNDCSQRACSEIRASQAQGLGSWGKVRANAIKSMEAIPSCREKAAEYVDSMKDQCYDSDLFNKQPPRAKPVN